jgi:hypothetical protein
MLAATDRLAIVDAPLVGVHALQRVQFQVGPKLSCNRLERRLPSELGLIGECQVMAECSWIGRPDKGSEAEAHIVEKQSFNHASR